MAVASLNQRDITRITLRYLKSYYRQRQREGSTLLSSDMRGAGGIIADGFLSFPQIGGEDFRATVEATSRDSQKEVVFQLRKNLLRWDSAAVAAALAATGFAMLYVQRALPMKEYTLVAWAGFLLVSWFMIFLFFRYLLSPFRRYRYIYAIEQFKQYYVDEQWVAIGEDVFTNYHDDRYYLELRNQCIYNGFGLIVVRENKPPLVQVTPSRQDLFKHRRQLVPFFSQVEVNKLFQEENYPDWLRQFTPRNFIDFRGKFKYQMAVCLISALLIGGVLYLESKDRPVNVLEYGEYVAEMGKAREKNSGNFMPDSIRPNLYLIDTPFIWPPPIRGDVSPYLNLGLAPEKPPGPSPLPEPEQPAADFFISYPGVSHLITYDCSRLKITGDAYVIQEALYPTFAQAADRIAELSSYGLEASGLWLGCFSDAGRGYVVFFGPVFRSSAEASRLLKDLETQLGDNVLGIRMEIHPLQPKASN